jgi:TonB family protein
MHIQTKRKKGWLQAWALGGASLVLALALGPNAGAADGNPPKVLKKVLPEFPQEAVEENILQGSVKVRVQTDAQGNVHHVQVLDYKPPKGKVFSESAIKAVKQWKFEATGKSETFELQLLFAE